MRSEWQLVSPVHDGAASPFWTTFQYEMWAHVLLKITSLFLDVPFYFEWILLCYTGSLFLLPFFNGIFKIGQLGRGQDLLIRREVSKGAWVSLSFMLALLNTMKLLAIISELTVVENGGWKDPISDKLFVI
jgi:hypothetical protein